MLRIVAFVIALSDRSVIISVDSALLPLMSVDTIKVVEQKILPGIQNAVSFCQEQILKVEGFST